MNAIATIRQAPALYERFFNGISGVDERGCWVWGKSRMGSGYGKLSNGGRNNLKTLGAHRVAYEFLHGPIPSGLCVMHACDNRLCVNPFHLSVGTKMDNSRDMVAKGRNKSPASLRIKCPKGHEYSGTNSKGARICRICARSASLRYYRKTKEMQ